MSYISLRIKFQSYIKKRPRNEVVEFLKTVKEYQFYPDEREQIQDLIFDIEIFLENFPARKKR